MNQDNTSPSQQPASYQHWRTDTDTDGVLWLTLDRAGEAVNSLGQAVLDELERIVTEVERKPPTGLVLMSGKPGSFIAGADVREFDQVPDAATARGYIMRVHALFDRIEALSCPTAVAFEGFCLGGGLELALCFNYRIARDVPATKIGFPEVQLGIYPGFGGSARTIHKLGGHRALPLILQARNLNARQARALGLVDQVIGRHEELRWAARRAVLAKKRSAGPDLQAQLANSAPARSALVPYIRKQTAAKAKPEHYPAPFALIDAFAAQGGNRRGLLNAEVDNVARLLTGDTSRNLRRVFGLMERLKAEGKGTDFKPARVHVVGAGVMGGDIAAWCALRGLEVTLQDRELALIEPALKRAQQLFRKRLRSPAKVAAASGRLRADVAGAGVARADVVIEAIFENLEAKQTLFRELEPKLRPHALLATNTSALQLRDLAAALARPERLIGLHFFNPVAQMPLVEVVYDPDLTDPAEAKRGAAVAAAIGKFPLPVKSRPGFLVNRVLAAYMVKALQLHKQGYSKEALDAAAERFGMPMGPVELADTVGLDVGLSVMRILAGDTQALEAELETYVTAGKKGKKTGEGLYRWQDGKPVKDANATQGADLDGLARQLIEPYLEECEAALAEGIVADADLLDAGMVFGTGFPPFRGGPLHYLRNRGPAAPPPPETAPIDRSADVSQEGEQP